MAEKITEDALTMCGRYVAIGPISRYQAYFDAELIDVEFKPRYNVAPSQILPVIRQADGGREITKAQWGLIPIWSKADSKLPKPINAVSETAAIKPMFRHAFRKSRVLVPADAFYEWKVVADGKQPMLIRLKSGDPMGFAGLLEHWPGPEGDVQTFTILTTTPNPLMADIHNRMPAIIRQEDYAGWLDPGLSDVEVIQRMLMPYQESLMEAYPVNKRVNSPLNEGAELIERLAL
ncbi:MAG: SOS response-associated peptidase [Georgfuchsia sp.]